MLDPFLNYLTNRGPAGMLADYYGKAIMPALNAPGKAVRSLVSPGGNEDVFNQAMDYGGRAGSMQGIPGIAMAGGTKLGDEWARYLLDSKGPTQNPALSMFDAMASGNPAADVTGPIGQMIGSTALDPLTYLGSGVTSRAPSIIKTGESLLQSGINKAFLGPALLPKAALGVPLPSFIGNRLTRTVEDPLTDSISQAPAHSVADYLFGGPSRRGFLSQYGDDIKNMTSRLMTGGHNLELDMADLHNARTGNLIPELTPQTDITQGFADVRNRVIGAARTIRSGSPALGRAVNDITNQYSRQIQGLPQDQLWQEAHKLADTLEHVQSRITPGTAPEDLHDLFRRRMDALGFLADRRTGILADLPDALRTRAEVAFGAMTAHGNQLLKDRQSVEAALKTLWTETDAQRGGTLGPYQKIGNLGSSSDMTQAIDSRLQAMGHAPITVNPGESYTQNLLDFLKGQVNDVLHNKAHDALTRWSTGGDLLTNNPYGLVMDKTIRDRATALGLNQDRGMLMSGLGNLTNFWKTISLGSPKYLLANLSSGLLMSGMAGVSPAQISKNFARNMLRMLQNQPLVMDNLAQQNARLGREAEHVPAGINAAGLLEDTSRLRDLTGQGQDILQRIGTLPMLTGGALTGAAGGYIRAQETGADDTAYQTGKGALVGAATFGSMPWLSKNFYQPLASGTEHVLRSGALVEGRSRFLADQVQPLLDIIQSHAAQPLHPQILDNLRQGLENQGGQISTQSLDTILGKLGAYPDARSHAIDQWRNILNGADQAGVDLSNHINFDYSKLNNFEEFARQLFPFSTWGTKALPFFAQHIAEHPVIGSTIANFEQQSEQDRNARGLSPRFAGSAEVPAMSDIWSTLTGQPGRASFFNPLRDIFPASDSARAAAFEPPDSATAYQKVSQLLDVMGLSQHPVVGLAARLAGQDPGAPSEGLSIRQAGPVQALTGVDLGAPGRGLETAARKIFGQEEPSDPRTQSTLRRIDELALRETGQPITAGGQNLAPYVRAKSDRSGPVWERALHDVDRERGTRSLSGFVAPFVTPSTTLGPEEARISQARAGLLLSADTSRAIQASAAQSPNEPAHPEAVQAITQAVQELVTRNVPGGQVPPDVQVRLDHPTWKNIDSLRNQIYEAQVMEHPELRGYSGSGSAEKQRLQNATQTYHNMPALTLNDPALQELKPETRDQLIRDINAASSQGLNSRQYNATLNRTSPGVAKIRDVSTRERDKLVSENPILGAYLQYQQDVGDKASLDDFLTRVWPRIRAGSGS